MDNTKQWIRCSGFKCPHLPNTCTSSLQYQAQVATDMDNKNSALRQPTPDAMREVLREVLIDHEALTDITWRRRAIAALENQHD